MKSIKFDLKKFKLRFKLATILSLVLLLVFLAEIFVVYKHVYLNLLPIPEPEPNFVSAIRINFPAYKNFEAWFELRQNYQIPPYELESEGVGRDNPFAEYPR